MKRRSFLAMLGLAPVAAAVPALAKPLVTPNQARAAVGLPPLPVVFGKRLPAEPFTVMQPDDGVVRAFSLIGYGTIGITEIKVGDQVFVKGKNLRIVEVYTA